MSSKSASILSAFQEAATLPGWGWEASQIPTALVECLEAEYGIGTCYPSPDAIFRALKAVRTPGQVRVVILGQDPYHGPDQAHGLAFSVRAGQPLPPSLRNIYKEIARSCGGTPPGSGDLSHWADQGVLLLNDVLTVRKGQPRSHADLGWQQLTADLIGRLDQRPAAFLLWGAHARRHAGEVRRLHPDHLILEAPHPSPLSAHRGFMGCGHFEKVNDWLLNRGEDPISWWPENSL